MSNFKFQFSKLTWQTSGILLSTYRQLSFIRACSDPSSCCIDTSNNSVADIRKGSTFSGTQLSLILCGLVHFWISHRQSVKLFSGSKINPINLEIDYIKVLFFAVRSEGSMDKDQTVLSTDKDSGSFTERYNLGICIVFIMFRRNNMAKGKGYALVCRI